jgi:hypothetical protein
MSHKTLNASTIRRTSETNGSKGQTPSSLQEHDRNLHEYQYEKLQQGAIRKSAAESTSRVSASELQTMRVSTAIPQRVSTRQTAQNSSAAEPRVNDATRRDYRMSKPGNHVVSLTAPLTWLAADQLTRETRRPPLISEAQTRRHMRGLFVVIGALDNTKATSLVSRRVPQSASASFVHLKFCRS